MSKIITCIDETKFIRCSRWITLKTAYITKRHSLYELAEKDGDIAIIDYITHKGYKIAVSSMYGLGSMFISEQPHIFIEHKEKHIISAVDMDGNIYDPYYIEIDQYNEKFRLYKKL